MKKKIFLSFVIMILGNALATEVAWTNISNTVGELQEKYIEFSTHVTIAPKEFQPQNIKLTSYLKKMMLKHKIAFNCEESIYETSWKRLKRSEREIYRD